MRFLRRTECIVGIADKHSKIGENAIGHFRVSNSRWGAEQLLLFLLCLREQA